MLCAPTRFPAKSSLAACYQLCAGDPPELPLAAPGALRDITGPNHRQQHTPSPNHEPYVEAGQIQTPTRR